eukprot:657257-Pelagomonas_calceolata.AAC.1
MRWSLLEWILINWRAHMQELSWRLMCRLVPSRLAKYIVDKSMRSAIRIVRRLRLLVRCLVEGSSRIDMSAKVRHLWYPTQIEGLYIMFDNHVYHGIPNDKACWCARNDCKSIDKARDNGCMDNVKRLTWGSIEGVKMIKLIFEVTGHALNLMLPI